MSVGFDSFGNNIYQENQTLIGWALSLIEKFNFGIKISFNCISIKNYGTDSSIGLSVGFLYLINPDFSLGVTLFNLYQFDLSESLENNNSNFSVGFAYLPFKNLTFFTTISREMHYTVDYKFGLEYNFENDILTRFGYENSLDTASFGVGIKVISIIFNYALRWHQWLGASHAISLEIKI